MRYENKKRWLDACAEAAICSDAERLTELASEINAILREERRGLELQAANSAYDLSERRSYGIPVPANGAEHERRS